MVTHAFDNSVYAAITDAETFAGNTADIGLAAGAAVEGYVADDHVFVRVEARVSVRINDNLAAG